AVCAPAPPVTLLLARVCQRHRPSTLFPYTTLFRSPCTSSAKDRPSNTSSSWPPTRFAVAIGMPQDVTLRRATSMRSACLLMWYRSEEHTSELQSRENLVCRLLLAKKKIDSTISHSR